MNEMMRIGRRRWEERNGRRRNIEEQIRRREEYNI